MPAAKLFRGLAIFGCAIGGALASEPLRVSAVPQAVRTDFKLSPVYTKYLDASGLSIGP